MTKDEALKLALKALETSMYPQQKQLQAITAIKEALAQQALDRKAENARELGLDYEPEKTVCPFCTSEWVTAEQHDRNVDRVEQEPCCYGGIAHDCHAGKGCRIVERMKAATPPQRTWVGLTQEEIYSVLENLQVMYNRPPTTDSRIIFARAIEAKLKEKNNA